MMDDIIDLELEKVNQILAKISKDPEDEDIRLSLIHICAFPGL